MKKGELVMETEPAVSLAKLKKRARQEFLSYQIAEGVVRAIIFMIVVTAAFAVLIWVADGLHSPRLQLVGIVGLALTLVICGIWAIKARRRALARFKEDNSSLASFI